MTFDIVGYLFMWAIKDFSHNLALYVLMIHKQTPDMDSWASITKITVQNHPTWFVGVSVGFLLLMYNDV